MKKFALAAFVALATVPAIFAEGSKEETTTPATEETTQESKEGKENEASK
jgi:hypothetical protein